MSTLRRIASAVDDGLDLVRVTLRRIGGHYAPVTVRPHRGFGTPRRLTIDGHVITRVVNSTNSGGLMEDLRATLRRYAEGEVMGARVTVRHGDAEARAVTDADGFFEATLPVALEPADRVLWHPISVTLEGWPGARGAPPQETRAEAMVPPDDAQFGVISDIDDTVMRTGMGSMLRNWRQMIRSDPARREAYPGLPELYRALTHDARGVQRNPIFYVSSAARGFYDLFTRFLDLKDIPHGPIFLKDYGLDRDQWFIGDHVVHKTAAIERVFGAYPDLSFILVGDSGQHDARIYHGVAERHPGRVRAVWIRDVSGGAAKRGEIEGLIDELNAQGVPAAFGPDLLAAAREAASAGWIRPGAIAEVEAAVTRAAAR